MTFAQFVGSGSEGIIGVINTVVVPLIGSLIFLVFIWGVVKYFFINNEGDTEKLKEGLLDLGVRKLIVIHARHRARRVMCHTYRI